VRPAAKMAMLIGCPLLSALTLGPLAFGVAALLGVANAFTIGLIVAAAVFLMSAAALCMALTRGEIDEQMRASMVLEADAAQHALAS
jgi:uncharacterized membrane protein